MSNRAQHQASSTQPSNKKSEAMNFVFSALGNRDIAFATAVCLILAMLFVPLPTVLLDFGLAISLALSVLILMVALWIPRPLDFSSFPTILLVVTMLRLALNVSSTRLILSEGHTGTASAGQVIEGFSRFVVGGDFVIGVVIFAILVVINFVVITKGSTRIAEVSARFSLDAMPGKQMAIDADLGSGAITEETARQRRKVVEEESAFFGAMDGASKFVRGDAVAGIIITIINVVGGIIIGVVQYNLSIGQAANNYTVLTIGDGLVTQIPALIVSLAAGIIVTKGGTEGATNEAILSQLGRSSRALYMSAALLVVVGLLPGFPFLVFVSLAAALAGTAYMLDRKTATSAAEAVDAENAEADTTALARPEDLLRLDDIRVDLGANLATMVNRTDAALLGKMKSLRNMFVEEYGLLLPMIRIKDNAENGSSEYTIFVHGTEVARAELRPALYLAIAPQGQDVTISGEKTREPAFGLAAVWIDPATTNEAEAQGYTVVDPESVITTHITEVVKSHLPDLMSYAATQRLVNGMDRDYQKLVTEISNPSPLSLVQHVLQSLLSEQVSIRNLPLIVEAIAEAAADSKNIEFITDHARARLSNQICRSLLDASGYLPVLTMSNAWEGEFASHTKVNADQKTLTLDPQRTHEFIIAARQALQPFAERDERPSLLVQSEFRTFVRQMLERVSPMTPVLSHNEVHRSVRLRTVGTIGD